MDPDRTTQPSWIIFYAQRLKATLQTCPCNTFLKLHPPKVSRYPPEWHCSVLKRDTYSPSTPFPPLCVISRPFQDTVHRLYKTIYEVAKDGKTRCVPFENGTVVQVITRHTTPILATLTLRMDPRKPPSQSFTHFDTASDCLSTKRFVDTTQQHQYTETHPSFVSNPRFAKLPIDQWYPNVPRYPQTICYDQLLYTAGDWSDLWYHAMYTSYTRMRTPRHNVPRTLRPRVKHVMQQIEARFLDKNSPYFELSPNTTLNTLRYMFQKQQKGVFVRLRNNSLDTFLPFIRHNFTNDYYHTLQLPTQHTEHTQDHRALQQLYQYESQLNEWDTLLDKNDPQSVSQDIKEKYKKTLRAFLHLEYQCAIRYAERFPPNIHRPDDVLKKNPNRRQWLANNHFFNTAVYYDLSNVHHFYHLLQQLVQHRKGLPDIEFVLMLRDYPVLRTSKSKDTVSIHQPFPNVHQPSNAVQMQCKGGLTPILSHTGKDGYYDIPLPTVDDIEHYEQKYFLMKCSGSNIETTAPTSQNSKRWVDWKDKTIAQAVFRGSATGQGTTAQTNLRLKVKRIANETRYAHLFDVELNALNTRVKADVHANGLQLLDAGAIQKQLHTGTKKHFLASDDRARYKYNLVLDGHTRADRLGNELSLGSLVILPTTDGHRLWLEPYLRPLQWERIRARRTEWSMKAIHKHKYTHITIHTIDEIGNLVEWLVNHDDVAEAIVQNAFQWLFKDGFYTRCSPETNFLYDYMEGVVRALAKKHRHSTAHPYTLIPSKSPSKGSKGQVVGLVVGFRDSVAGGNGPRSQQLRQFCDYFDSLFPSWWTRVIVIVEQAIVQEDRKQFDAWWVNAVGRERNDLTVYDYIQILKSGKHDQSLPVCLQRNLALVHNDCALMCGADKHHIEMCKMQRWTQDECYRRTAEQKFNLGLLKNAGYAYLQSTYTSKLSHVIFTDIDMLPDHELAPYYLQQPKTNELIALATRGTIYDSFRIDNMPTYTLTSQGRQRQRHHHHHHHQHHHHPHSHPHPHTQTKGGRRKYRRRSKRYNKPKYDVKHTRNNNPHVHHHHHHHTQRRRTNALQATPFEPKTASGQPCIPLWMSKTFKRFLGAAVSFSPSLFEAINGYPNNYWGWGGEDDEIANRLAFQNPPVVYTVPEKGRLVDLEMAEPVATPDKLAHRVKEMQKREKLSQSRQTWQTNGLHQLDTVCRAQKTPPTKTNGKHKNRVVRVVVHC